MKGQSFIVEFILFFMLSFALFSTISTYFFNQNKYFGEQIGEKTTESINNLVSTSIVRAMACKECDRVSLELSVPPRIGNLYYKITLSDAEKLTTELLTKDFSEQASIFNIGETFDLTGEVISERKNVKVDVDSFEGEIEVS